MAKMKFKDVDWDGLEDEEFDPEDTGDFVDYDGEIPPKNTLLSGDITKLWLVKSQAGDWMYKALFIADCGHKKDKEGYCKDDCDKAEYNGCPIWDNVLWSLPQVKFKWGHFLHSLDITLKDVKAKTLVDDEDDNVGTPVKKVGEAKFPFPVSVITDREKYEGEWKATVRRWVPVDSVDDDDEDEDDAPVAKKSKAKSKAGKATSKKRRASNDDDDDDVPF